MMIYTVTLNPALDREYIVPRLKKNYVLRATNVRIDYGGKGFNVSRMLHSLYTKSTALGFVGGKTGQVLEKGLSSLGITTDFVHIKDETRTNTTIVEKDGKDHYKVNQSGAVISKSELGQLVDKIKCLLRQGDWWVLAGSLPPGVPDDFYARVIKLIQSAGARAILDTSGNALTLGIKAHPFLVKPNLIEAQTFTRIKENSLNAIIDMAEIIHAHSVHYVSISAGKKFSLFSNNSNIWQAFPPKIIEGNPVGAGDAMLAGLIYGFSKGLSEQESFIWGVASGSTAAAKTGTRMPSIDEVREVFNTIRIEQIKR